MENQEKPKPSDFQKLRRLESFEKILELAGLILEAYYDEIDQGDLPDKIKEAQASIGEEIHRFKKRLSGGITRPGLQNGEQPEFIIPKPTTSNDTKT